jgi:hypothetical protein
MARPKKSTPADNQDLSVLEKSVKQAETEKLPIEEMPLETLRDYRLYNEEARKLNKKLRLLRYPIKQCPVELHPHQRIEFSNNDKSMNPVPVYLSDHMIHYDETWIPGQQYDVPEYIVSYMASKGNPVWQWVTLKDGSRETRQTGKQKRFSITSVYTES